MGSREVSSLTLGPGGEMLEISLFLILNPHAIEMLVMKACDEDGTLQRWKMRKEWQEVQRQFSFCDPIGYRAVDKSKRYLLMKYMRPEAAVAASLIAHNEILSRDCIPLQVCRFSFNALDEFHSFWTKQELWGGIIIRKSNKTKTVE